MITWDRVALAASILFAIAVVIYEWRVTVRWWADFKMRRDERQP